MADQEKEIDRLKRTIRDFELVLRRAGHEELAGQLERMAR